MESTLIPGSAAALEAPPEERFELRELLGRGGMGEVWKAWDRELELTVALKALRPGAARDPRLLERFRREAKLARRIKHVNVAQMFDLIEMGGRRYLCMEHVDGRTLTQILAAKRSLPLRLALGLIRQVCSGVQAAHEAGVVHRDLKPQNVMVTRRHGRVCILDFGIARELGSEEFTEAGIILGSPQYLSYEQLAGAEATERSDIYQIGILLYEMVTGVSPFRAPGTGTAALRALREIPPDPRHHDARLPAWLADTVLRCLSKYPEDRPATPLDLMAALDAPRLAAGSPPDETGSIEIDGSTFSIGAAPAALVAMPDARDRAQVADRLRRLGCAVECVADGTQAVGQAWARAFALVVLAPELTGMDGFTACRIVRRSPVSAGAHVLLVTSPHDGRAALAREAGAADVLHAPLNVHAFSRAVRRLLAGVEDAA